MCVQRGKLGGGRPQSTAAQVMEEAERGAPGERGQNRSVGALGGVRLGPVPTTRQTPVPCADLLLTPHSGLKRGSLEWKGESSKHSGNLWKEEAGAGDREQDKGLQGTLERLGCPCQA